MRSSRFFRVFRILVLILAAAFLLPAAVSAGDPVTEPLTVTVFRGDPGNQPAENNRIYQLIEQEFGIRFEFEFLDEDGDLDEAIGQLVDNGLPDLIDGSNSAEYLEDGGALIDLLPYITQEGTPNLYEHVYGNDRVSKMTRNGKLYIIPNYGIYDNDPVSVNYNGPSFFIQKQVIAWNDYKVPTTLNEYFDLIERFAAAHPDDGYTGFEMLNEGWRTWALLNPVQHLMGRPNDGDVLVDVSTPEYTTETFINQDYAKAYYAKLNEMYNKGIISADTFNLNYDDYIDSLAAGNVLGTFDQKWNMNQAISALDNAGMYENNYLAIPLVYDPEYVGQQEIEEHYVNGAVMNINRGFGISASCEDPERMVQLFEALLSDEWQTLLQWGVLGEDYSIDENGRMVMTEEQYRNINNPEWRLANMADALFTSSPKKQGTMDDGNAWDPNSQPENTASHMNEYDREFLEACGVQSAGEFFNPPIELAPYGEAWEIDKSPIMDNYNEFLAIQLESLPEIIMCDPNELDDKWDEFVEAISPSAAVVTEYMQAAILALVNGQEMVNNRCGKDLTWEYDDEFGVLTISGSGKMYDYDDAESVPWAKYAYDIGTVIIENGVTSIGNNAFNGCVCLESISIPYGMTKIGNLALNDCKSLESINLPQTVTEFGYSAFQSCENLRTFTVPGNASWIGEGMFRQCRSLETVNIPVSVEYIFDEAFDGCQGLTDVCYAGTEEQWNNVYVDSSGNEYLLGASMHFSSLPVAESGDCGAEGSNLQWTLDVYNTLTITGTGAMADYSREIRPPWRWSAAETTKINIADGVTRIGSMAFYFMTHMTEIRIPASVESIGAEAFDGWISLETVYYGGTQDQWAGVTVSETGNGYLLNAKIWCLGPHEHVSVEDPAVDPDPENGVSGLTAGSHCEICGEVFVPQKVIPAGFCGKTMFFLLQDDTLEIWGSGEMDDYSWEEPAPWRESASDIQKVVLGEGIRSIGDNAFESCNQMSEAVLNEGLVSIGNSAFAFCHRLDSVMLPSTLESIGSFAFDNTDLSTVTIPASVSTIGQSAFNDCSSLESISVEQGNRYYSSSGGVLFDREKHTLIRYPIGKDGSTYSIPQSVTAIAVAAFTYVDLESVELPDSLVTVGDSAFFAAQSLRRIVFPAGGINIGACAFEFCVSLRTVIFPNRNVTVGEYAFDGCGNLSAVYYAGTQAERGEHVSLVEEGNSDILSAAWHYGMTRLPADLTRIEDEAFRNCDFGMVVIPDGCGEIGEYAFAGCGDLIWVSIPASVTNWPETAFSGCHPDLVIVRSR